MKSKKLKNSKGEPLKLTYRHVVVGSSLEALLFAYYNRYHIVWTRNLCPMPFEVYPSDWGLGTRPNEIWRHHAFLMGMANYIPFADNIRNIHMLEGNTLKLVSHEDYIYKLKYRKLHVFDDNNLLGLNTPEKRLIDAYRVIDWFQPTYMETGRLGDYYRRKDPMFREIFLYPGTDTGQSKYVCAYSYCSEKELADDTFPVYLASVRMEKYLKELVGRGTRRGRSNHVEREVINLSQNLYRDSEDIKFYNISPRLVHETSCSQKLDYITYLKDRLCLKPLM